MFYLPDDIVSIKHLFLSGICKTNLSTTNKVMEPEADTKGLSVFALGSLSHEIE